MTRQDSMRDPRWARLVDLVAGELSAEEAAALKRWVDTAPERGEALAQIEAIWRATDVSAELDAVSGEEELQRIKAEASGGGRIVARVGPARLPASRVEPVSRQRSRIRALVQVAAALMLVTLGGLLWRLRAPTPAATPAALALAGVAEYRTAPGERLSLHLPDGTEVRLAPGGRLRRPSNYGVHNRVVELQGEAYFAVAHDSTRPFFVYDSRAATRVLGTRFLVRAYPDESTTDIVVAEGRVAVRGVDPAGDSMDHRLLPDSLILTARDRATVSPRTPLRLTRGVDVSRYANWIDGRLVFEDAPLREVVRRLDRWYGIDVRLADPALGDRHVTVTLRDETASQAVDLVATVLRLTVARSQATYVLGAGGR